MPDRTPRVCLSAGHGLSSRAPGATDPGARIVNAKATEADVVLAFAKQLDADFAVLFRDRPAAHFLRDGGVYHDADDYAAAHACDLFVELHTDATPKVQAKPDGKKRGGMVIYEAPASRKFASNMAHVLAEASGLPFRPVLRTDLAVLTPHSGMVAVLVELMTGTDADDVNAWGHGAREKLELAILNCMLGKWGWRRVNSLPRTWGWLKRRTYRPF